VENTTQGSQQRRGSATWEGRVFDVGHVRWSTLLFVVDH
jgi:hypothetical protein